MSAPEMVEFEGRLVRRFVSYPAPVTDGTIRCGVCGQLDEFEHHDDAMCTAIDAASRLALQGAEHDQQG